MIRGAVLAAIVFSAAACGQGQGGMGCEGPAGPLGPVELPDGGYALVTLFQSNDEFRFGATEALEVQIDRAAGTVTLTYDEAGVQVEEVWRITFTEVR